MGSANRYFFLAILLLPAFGLFAQKNIAGTWEGDLGTDQFLQLNIVQDGDRICGYSWDYVKRDQRSFCKAYFTGRYDSKKGKWMIEGTSFIDNSGGHLLMRLVLGNHSFNEDDILEGSSAIRSVILSFITGGANDDVYLKKVASRPTRILPGMEDCFPKQKKPIVDTPAVITKIPEQKKVDSVPIIDTPQRVLPPADQKTDSIKTVIAQIPQRKNKEQSHLEVNTRKLTLNVYDNAVVDGDTVSIFYNGRLLVSHQRLSEKPIVIELELDEKQTRHEILLFAENLGGIPPNTALIVVYAGNKRYELFSSASLEENAVLVFDYKPK